MIYAYIIDTHDTFEHSHKSVGAESRMLKLYFQGAPCSIKCLQIASLLIPELKQSKRHYKEKQDNSCLFIKVMRVLMLMLTLVSVLLLF